MIAIPIWQVRTRNTPKLLSHLPVYIWRCLNREYFFCTQESLKSTQQANLINVWTIEPICAHMWVCPSVHPCVTKSCPGHNFKGIKASNFKLHTQIGHIVENCTVQEP